MVAERLARVPYYRGVCSYPGTPTHGSGNPSSQRESPPGVSRGVQCPPPSSVAVSVEAHHEIWGRMADWKIREGHGKGKRVYVRTGP
jgi:hypothetical protein